MLKIAIQSKGRLNEESLALLAEAGIKTGGGSRRLVSRAEGFDMEILYLRDDDIPGAVGAGVADIGIVGYNEVAERGVAVECVAGLGFGRCRLSVALPKGVAYEGPSSLAGLRIATSYPHVLGDWLGRTGVEASVCEIAGSVEIAPAVGMADAIFDIVSSGGTLIQNGLREVERVIDSEAVLIATPGLGGSKREALDKLLFRFRSILAGRGMKYLLLNIPEASVGEAVGVLPGMKSPTVVPLAQDGWCSIQAVVAESELWDKIERLKEIGAEDILVLNLENIIR